MSFAITYVGGGVIDKVRELPYPHFSKKTLPYIVGRKLDVQASLNTFIDRYLIPYNAEWLSVAVACSEYCIGDYWELSINGTKVCETIYTKELPESVSMGNSFGIVYPVSANTEFKFDFVNMSGSAKSVWYNLKFLR